MTRNRTRRSSVRQASDEEIQPEFEPVTDTITGLPSFTELAVFSATTIIGVVITSDRGV